MNERMRRHHNIKRVGRTCKKKFFLLCVEQAVLFIVAMTMKEIQVIFCIANLIVYMRSHPFSIIICLGRYCLLYSQIFVGLCSR